MTNQILPEEENKTFHLNNVDSILISAKDKLLNPSVEKYIEDLQVGILICVYGDSYNDHGIESIFDESIPYNIRKFIAISLLRLWSYNDGIFEFDRSFQHKALKLFDLVFEQNFYRLKEISIKPSDQSFVKANKLKDFISGQEEKFMLIQNYNIDSVSSIEGFKKVYLSTTRGSELKSILPHFIPKESSSIIDNIFNKVKEYISCESEGKIIAYNGFNEYLNNLPDTDSICKTYYYEITIKDVLKRIKNVVVEDFNNSPYGKPAKLQLMDVNKKYPFSHINYGFKFGLLIFNHSEGHATDVTITIDEISANAIIDKDKYVGSIKFGETLAEFNCTMLEPAKEMIVVVTCSWENFDKTFDSVKAEFLLSGQRDDIDWETLSETDFYSIEAVDSEDELVGRREILKSLITRIEGKRVGSSYIYGQRRVGKSSIVKTLKTELEKSGPGINIIFYQETGDYKDPDPNITINQLAINICNKIRYFNPKLNNIPIPEFRGALSPLSGYLSTVSEFIPNARILIILDEFDKIPVELYRKGEIGDTFFDTIRAISNKGPYGFLLVGGERMEFIMRDQSQEVNKFKSIRVDYFSKNSHWKDFRDLVVRPIQDFFEVNEEAIDYLYEQTAGNPFFTKVICEELMNLMVARKDNHVTLSDMIEAKEKAIDGAGEQIFAHFWRDGIRDLIVNEIEVTSNRRKVLIAITNVINAGKDLNETNIVDQALGLSVSELAAHSTLNEFIERDVLLKHQSNSIDFKVLFFKDWLLSGGVDKLKMTLVEKDRFDQELISSELARVKSEELVRLVSDWHPYRGQEITTDRVRAWLEQFGDNGNQRLMFKILQNIHFYSDFELRAKMKQIYNEIKRAFIETGKVRKLVSKELKRGDILVSYLEDNPAKSGSEYAKLFADENQIFYKNVIAPERLERFLENNKNINSIVFVDDFIGSGTSAIENVSRLYEQYPNLFADTEINFHYAAICGYQEGKHKITTRMKRQKINLQIHLIDVLDETNKVFDPDSRIFSASERHKARAICYTHGSNLVKNNSLGFGNGQAITVFPRTIPNNCLPILWAENRDWKALFPRPM